MIQEDLINSSELCATSQPAEKVNNKVSGYCDLL